MVVMETKEARKGTYRVSVDNQVWYINRQIASGVIVALSVVIATLLLGWQGLLVGAFVALVTRASDWLEWRGATRDAQEAQDESR
jgi:hypothetical protein